MSEYDSELRETYQHCWRAGYEAREAGETRECPWDDSNERDAWNTGWDEANREFLRPGARFLHKRVLNPDNSSMEYRVTRIARGVVYTGPWAGAVRNALR
jgi:ribosome modulation factor